MDKIDTILMERGGSHGDFEAASNFAQQVKAAVAEWSKGIPLSPVQAEAMDMIILKMSRIVTGDPNHIDHWDDIAGYAKLASNHIEKMPTPPPPTMPAPPPPMPPMPAPL